MFENLFREMSFLTVEWPGSEQVRNQYSDGTIETVRVLSCDLGGHFSFSRTIFVVLRQSVLLVHTTLVFSLVLLW